MVHFWEEKKKTLTRKSRNIAQKLHLYMLPRKRTGSNIVADAVKNMNKMVQI